MRPHTISLLSLLAFGTNIYAINPSDWTTQIVDSANLTGTANSLEIDIYGRPHLSYVQRASGPASQPTLKYATKNGTWTINNVLSNVSGDPTSIALKSNQQHAIAHSFPVQYSDWNGTTYNHESPTSFFSFSIFPILKLDAADNPHFFCISIGTPELEYYYKSAGVWTSETVATPPNNSFTDIGFDLNLATNQAHFSHYNDLNGDLIYVKRTAASSYASSVADSGTGGADVGAISDLVLDKNGLPHIAYTDRTNHALLYVFQDSSGNWNKETITSNSTNDYTNVDMEIDASGRVHTAAIMANQSGFIISTRSLNGIWTSCIVNTGITYGAELDLECDPCGNLFVSHSDTSSLSGNMLLSSYTKRDAEDSDLDGIPSLIEYLTGTDPGTPNTCVTNLTKGTGANWQFSYPRFSGGTINADMSYTWGEFTYNLEISTDLQNWSSVNTSATYNTSPISSNQEQLTATFPSTLNKFFIRLVATRG